MQQKKLTHGSPKEHNRYRMAKYDYENARAWAVIMDKIRQEYAAGNTQLAIAKRLGVTKVAVSRWLSEDRGGERTTFGDMLRYAKALGIPFSKLIGEAQPTFETTSFDKALATVLEQCTKDADLTPEKLAHRTGLSTEKITAVLNGTRPVTGADLHTIAIAIEVGASILFKKAAKLLETEQA